MSDFPLSLENIDLLINGKIPLTISQNRLSRAAYQVLYNFILAIHPGQSETPCTLVTFSRRFTLLPFKKIKILAFLDVQIYIHQERMQTKRVTSSTIYFFLRFSFDDEPFHLKIFTGEKIYLPSLHFIHKSR